MFMKIPNRLLENISISSLCSHISYELHLTKLFRNLSNKLSRVINVSTLKLLIDSALLSSDSCLVKLPCNKIQEFLGSEKENG